ncbi:PucR family transcriptional regulator [Nocardia vinacea]|uniref:PucR family transcriptional regulator n=1 Tax=Nocardia vinacea TaxID=96468 RepID=UPI0002F7913F|nr:helix-turn-helix domain-containing protein [Nocardia vinacea]
MTRAGTPLPGADGVVQSVCEKLLAEPAEVMSDLHDAVFAAAIEPFRTEPSLVAEITASSRANLLHWAASVRSAPREPVTANLSAEVVGIARDAFRRGVEQILVTAYHAGHNALWRHWMRLAFTVSSNPVVLQEALDVAARSLADFVDVTLAALAAQLESERAELTRDSHAQRFELVSLVLEGAPMANDRASDRLGYRFEGRHTAAVLWTDPGAPDRRGLQRAAEALGAVTQAQQTLDVIASSTSVWTWLANATAVDAQTLAAATSHIEGVRIAMGPADTGVEGFRRSHLDAVETQRLMQRLPDLHFASFADVQLVTLATYNEQRAIEFVARTLGRVATADAELRETLRIYIREQFSASRAARTLFAHRNTVLNRIQRAAEMLPVSLDTNGLEIGVALEIAHWLGHQPT